MVKRVLCRYGRRAVGWMLIGAGVFASLRPLLVTVRRILWIRVLRRTPLSVIWLTYPAIHSDRRGSWC